MKRKLLWDEVTTGPRLLGRLQQIRDFGDPAETAYEAREALLLFIESKIKSGTMGEEIAETFYEILDRAE